MNVNKVFDQQEQYNNICDIHPTLGEGTIPGAWELGNKGGN